MELYVRDFPDDLNAWAKKAAIDEKITLKEFVINLFKKAVETERNKKKGGE